MWRGGQGCAKERILNVPMASYCSVRSVAGGCVPAQRLGCRVAECPAGGYSPAAKLGTGEIGMNGTDIHEIRDPIHVFVRLEADRK
jgi:hypothetical protein